jgi:translation elongation factor EF-Tu-like GTPase
VARLLITVEDTFIIQGRGLVPVPGLIPVGNERFKVGDPLLLKRPDGHELLTSIGGLELSTPNPRHEVGILLKDMSKEDVPKGTEIWSVDN